jgi:integrase
VKLNARIVAGLKLPDGKTEKFYWDDELKGFGFRLRREDKKGSRLSRTWVAQYRAKGRGRRQTIGDSAKVSAEEARAAAKVIFGEVAKGKDPQGEKQRQRLGAARTLRSVADDYLAMKQSKLRPASYRMAKLYLTGGYFRPLHAAAITDIMRADIAPCLNRIERDSGHVTAHLARSALSSLYSWALKEGIVEQNPVIGTRDPGKANARDRVLKDLELGHVWRACGDDDYGRIVRLMICTGCRRDEIGGLRWSEVTDDGTIELPAARVKNGHAHVLPLPPLAQSIIASIPQRAGREHLFGERSSGGHTGWARCKSDLDARLAGKVAAWRVHDLRRSVATRMADIGVEPHIIEAILNHYSGHRAGDAGVYNRSKYGPQIRAALALWNDHLHSLIEGGGRKVVSYRGRKAASYPQSVA